MLSLSQIRQKPDVICVLKSRFHHGGALTAYIGRMALDKSATKAVRPQCLHSFTANWRIRILTHSGTIGQIRQF
jgi:hypothetical protein